MSDAADICPVSGGVQDHAASIVGHLAVLRVALTHLSEMVRNDTHDMGDFDSIFMQGAALGAACGRLDAALEFASESAATLLRAVREEAA